jgi:hypothetical protein
MKGKEGKTEHNVDPYLDNNVKSFSKVSTKMPHALPAHNTI